MSDSSVPDAPIASGIPWAHQTPKSRILFAAAALCMAATLAVLEWIDARGGNAGSCGALALVAIFLMRASRNAMIKTIEPEPRDAKQRAELALIKRLSSAASTLGLVSGGFVTWYLIDPRTDPNRHYVLDAILAAIAFVVILSTVGRVRSAHLLKSLPEGLHIDDVFG